MIGILKDILSAGSVFSDAYIVGGSVRDMLTGREVKDIDLAINKDPYIIAPLFSNAIKGTYVPLNRRFMTARVVKDDYIFDLSMLYKGSIAADLKRRDFTINAMAVPLKGHESFIIDPYRGKEDISKKIIRMVSRDNLIADPVRLIRAFRFMSLLEFRIEDKTLRAVEGLKHLIRQSAIERIYTELKALLLSENAFDTIEIMISSGFFFELFPELKSSNLQVTLQIFREMETIINNLQGLPYYREINEYFKSESHIKILLKLSTLFINPTKDTFFETGVDGILNRLKVSLKEAKYISIIMKNFSFLLSGNAAALTKIDMARFLMAVDRNVYSIFVLCLSILRALRGIEEDRFMDLAVNLFSYYHNEYIPLSRQSRLINGDDLEAVFGLKPSVQFRVILNMVEELRLSGVISSKDEAVRVVEEFLVNDILII